MEIETAVVILAETTGTTGDAAAHGTETIPDAAGRIGAVPGETTDVEIIAAHVLCETSVLVFSPDSTPDLRQDEPMVLMQDSRQEWMLQIITTAVITDVTMGAAV